MKYLFAFALLISSYILQAQDWGGWQLVYGDKDGGNVNVSFKLSSCNGTDLKGYSFFRTNNEMGAGVNKGSVSFSFEYLTCENKKKSENVRVNLDRKGIDQGSGNWFLGYRVLRVYDVKYENTVSKDLKKRLVTVIDNYINSLEGAVAEIERLPNWSSNPGMVMMEYVNLMKDKIKEYKALLNNVDQYNSMTLAKIQEKINSIVSDKAQIVPMVAKARAESEKMMNKQKPKVKKTCNDADCPLGFKCNNGICTKINPKPKEVVNNNHEPKIPCDGNGCPIGYTCNNGLCVSNNAKPGVANKNNGMKLPCEGGCPIGYDCRKGFCVILTKEQKEEEEAEVRRIAAEDAKKKVTIDTKNKTQIYYGWAANFSYTGHYIYISNCIQINKYLGINGAQEFIDAFEAQIPNNAHGATRIYFFSDANGWTGGDGTKRYASEAAVNAAIQECIESSKTDYKVYRVNL